MVLFEVFDLVAGLDLSIGLFTVGSEGLVMVWEG